jgi:hypothetical protein
LGRRTLWNNQQGEMNHARADGNDTRSYDHYRWSLRLRHYQWKGTEWPSAFCRRRPPTDGQLGCRGRQLAGRENTPRRGYRRYRARLEAADELRRFAPYPRIVAAAQSRQGLGWLPSATMPVDSGCPAHPCTARFTTTTPTSNTRLDRGVGRFSIERSRWTHALTPRLASVLRHARHPNCCRDQAMCIADCCLRPDFRGRFLLPWSGNILDSPVRRTSVSARNQFWSGVPPVSIQIW